MATMTTNSVGITANGDITVLASSRAIISGRLTPATLTISQATGKITSVTTSVLPPSSFPPGTPYTDYSPLVLMPGLVDAHVHLNEPGRTEWEGFYTGTQAAAFGGVTTVVDMPLNSIPPTTTVDGLKTKVQAAEGQCWVDVAFYGGVVPGNASELKPLVKRGVRGFKGFLIDSGVEEFPAVTAKDIHKAMIELADERTTLMFHAEMVPHETGEHHHGTDDHAGQDEGKLNSYSTFLASRPSTFETSAVEEILALSHVAPQLPLHIVHLSAMQVIPLLREARVKGVNITAETCFHYLSLAAEDVSDGDTRHKCCPPIRERSNQDSLWQELERHAAANGVIKTVVSDHSPCTPIMKQLPGSVPGSHHTASSSSSSQDKSASAPAPAMDSSDGDFMSAWGGISSVGLGLSILWTELSQRYRGSSTAPSGVPFLEEVVQWCCVNTATQVGLGTQKGTLAVGYDADVCVFDPEAEWTVEPSTMLFRNKCSPYQGKTLKGAVKETWLGGRKVFSREDGFGGDSPGGRLLLEPRMH